MKLILQIAILAGMISNTIQAQIYLQNDWEETPEYYTLDSVDLSLPSVAIQENYIFEYKVRNRFSEIIDSYETKHAIIRVNSEKGINKHNRVYISQYRVDKVLDIKARVLQPDGSITVLNKENIKELKDVEDYGGFKIFAIEGVMKDSQIEYIYTLRKKANAAGTVFAQQDYKIKNCKISLVRPNDYRLKTKCYNGLSEMEEIVHKKSVEFVSTTTEIPAMVDEPMSAYRANKMKLSYFLRSKGYYVSDEVLWEGLERNIRSTYITGPVRRNRRLRKHFDQFMLSNVAKTDEDKINLVCEYVHSNFSIVKSSKENDSELYYVVMNKKGTEVGIAKVYTELFKHLDIGFEAVLTSNRFKHKFDKEFYSGSNFQGLLYYFPTVDKYINPSSMVMYLDYPSSNFIYNEAIFVTPVKAYFDTIKHPAKEYSITKKIFNISLDETDLTATVDCKEELTGFQALNSRLAYRYFKKEEEDMIPERMAARGLEDIEINHFEARNESLKNGIQNIPFEMEYNFTAISLTDDLGENVLLNIGKVIGTQNELYQEEERVNSVEIGFMNEYHYNFNIPIPAGYQVADMSAVNINKVLEIDGKPACSFVSNCVNDGNTLTITVKESYNQMEYDLKYYDQYRDVINAAYDFSNASIIFEKLN